LDEHLARFRTLSRCVATTHFNGQSTITLDGDSATGETYCLADHILENEHGRSLNVLAIRYEDAFAEQEGAGGLPGAA
jgi:hypothetical protein